MNPLGDLGFGYQRADIKFSEVCDGCRKRIAQGLKDIFVPLLERPLK
jgi:hypothetical protein